MATLVKFGKKLKIYLVFFFCTNKYNYCKLNIIKKKKDKIGIFFSWVET